MGILLLAVLLLLLLLFICSFCKRLGPADSRKITSYIHVQSANLIKKEFIKAAEMNARCFCFFILHSKQSIEHETEYG